MQGKEQRRKQVFKQIAPPGCSVGPMDARGNYTFIPWRGQTRDAAAPTTIKGRADAQLTLAKIVDACLQVDARLTALEAKRSALAQQQQQFQLAMTEQPTQQNMQTHDAAPPCSCQHQPAPQAPYRDAIGVAPMSSRHPGLAPMPFVRSGAFPKFDPPRAPTRDQSYGEKPPSRFSSQEADRMASYLPPGSAGRTSNKEAVNDINLRALRDSTGHNVSGPPGHMAEASDPAQRNIGSGPFDQYSSDVTRPSPAALSELNSQFNKAKTQSQKDSITDAWKRYVSGSRDDGSQWKPRQAEVHDAPWSSLYEANKGTIGGDPNKISPGMSLNLPGGGSHFVRSGETLSGIASTPAGTDLGSKSLASERGGVSPTGGSYSSGGSLSSGEGAPAGAPGMHNASNAPTPPSRPSEFGGSAQAAESPSSSSSSSETPTPPIKPPSLGGTGESPEGLNPQAGEGGGASPTGSEGTGLAKMVRGWVTGETE
jgi:LysM repeat protein